MGAGNALGHVPSLGDRRHEMILADGEKERGDAHSRSRSEAFATASMHF